MKIVTEQAESAHLEQQLNSSHWTLHDVVLDDGTWLPDTMVFNDMAFGLLIGGHTAFQFFRDVPQLVGRNVTHDLRLRRRHGSLLFGWWLRRRWARHVGARLDYPNWRARI
jgi:hypothetical protein